MKSTSTFLRRRAVAAAGIAAAAALALTACAPPGAAEPSGDASAPAGETGALKVGYISPTTGNFAVAGQEMVDGWNLYWETQGNEVNGVTIETIVEDDAGNPETSLTKARKLVEQDEVDVIVGPLIANTALAVAEYTASVGVPNLHPVAASDDLTQRNANDLTVRTGSMGGSQANYPGGEWAATEGGFDTAVTLCADYAFGWESCAGFVQGFVENGGEVVEQIWFPNSTTDFSTYASQIQAADADVVYVATAGGAPGPNFLNAYLGLGLDMDKLLVNCCAADQGTLRTMGDSIIGLKSISYWAEGRDSEVVTEFIEAYKEFSDGKVPGAYVAGGYITASLVASVLEENGLVTGEELVSAITEYTFEDSIFGRVQWDEYNNTVGPVYIREVEKLDDGNLYNVPIATFEDVDQWLGRTPEEALAQPTYSQTFQGLE
ncbi:ABC transporter substrate-binding protein [Microbacterium sp. CFH 90308]|uniref:ABC transporter substrate-binding protein n=1 Tax=Microbacterium salsuginis TaxID=2722803 RepID=A0ABX1K6K3_9MICO|nr:ABC transporter substrate-binding protein [Microbacterium sp. CFH 90308]NLP82648.1 ABC transporter substrate-binding protein [Microbacterium sp. CFH 90308]